MNSIDPKEKMKLMVELGMEEAAANYAEAKGLVNLKFRPITDDKIDNLLSKEYERVTEVSLEKRAAGYTLIIGSIVGAVLFWQLEHLMSLIFIPLFLFGASILKSAYPHKVRETAWVDHMSLEDWEWDLPYGALLAVKEAKQQKFKEFEIYYPLMQTSKRLKADPIIVGYKGNKMYNIFAWDDGKIYE